MKRWTLLGIALSLACVAGTAGAEDVRKTAEASMLVTGSVEVNPDGSLHGYTLDHPEKLPPEVLGVIGKSMPTWEFKLSGPTRQVVKASMNLRVVAKPAGDGQYMVTVAGTSFGDAGENTPKITSKDRIHPVYPRMAIESRVSGTVYLLMRIGRDGTVQDAIAEQVNLEQYATPIAMEKFRAALARPRLRRPGAGRTTSPPAGHRPTIPTGWCECRSISV